MKREVIIIKEIIARKKTLLCRVAVILGFCIFYLSGFSWLENRHVSGIHITACALDYKIPFQEIFIIPYLLWFVYIAATVIYFLLHEDENFNALAGTLALGMTLFLVVSAIYPNGLNLRPVTFERDNIFIRLVQFVYKNDTPTNVLPSIHVDREISHLILHKCSDKKNGNQKKQACPETKRLGMGHWYSDGSDYFSYCIFETTFDV